MNPMSQTYVTATSQTMASITSVDVKPIIENSESPIAIILAIAILISILMGSIIGFAQVIIIAALH
jgi:hypothetical protein